MRRPILCCALFVLASSLPVVAGPLTPEQTLDRRQPSDLNVSPDGRLVAFTVTEPPDGKSAARDIWLLDVASGRARALTQATKVNDSPRWSPDGRTLAFLSSRSGSPQIYLLPMTGGEARPLTKGDDGVRAFAWSPDGKRIAFLAPEPKPDIKPPGGPDDDAHVVDLEDRPDRLWIVDVASGERRLVSPAGWEVDELQWRPQGDGLIVSATDQPANDRDTNRIYAIAADGGPMHELAAPTGPFGGLTISPDGKWLAYAGARVDGPEPHDLYVLPLGPDGGGPRNITAAHLDRPVRPFSWTKDDTLLGVVQSGFTSRCDRIALDGTVTPLPAFPVNPSDAAQLPSGALAFIGETTTEAPEVWLAPLRGDAHAVTQLNAAWSAIPLVKPEFLQYKGFDGTDIEAALLRPAGATGPTPLVVLVHGGPTGRWSDRFEPWGQLLAARGFAVLYPNIRGSTGYGERFMESNRADWGGADFKDVMAGVDAMVQRGIADPARLGIGGWSYGGYMAEWAITQTTRFKAAVSGAGMANLMSEFGTEDGPSYDHWFWGAPYTKPEGFLQHSPVLFLSHAKTPTLILQGEADVTDPIGQSQELYRGLKWYGVDAEMVLYPREGHGLRERPHLLDRLYRIIGWYEKYLGKS
ncbi:MAG: S9 family peptidase [Acidobacteriota bacterium]|nr:S9 family peptidase [Acidobacteriota bacterium]